MEYVLVLPCGKYKTRNLKTAAWDLANSLQFIFIFFNYFHDILHHLEKDNYIKKIISNHSLIFNEKSC